MTETWVFLTYVRFLVLSVPFYRICLSIKATKSVWAFASIRLSHNSTEYLHTCLVQLCCARIGKYETDDKCYDQLGRNITTYLVLTRRPKVVTTKFVFKRICHGPRIARKLVGGPSPNSVC